MTAYPELDWSTLNFVRSHLYRRLVNPLNNALGRMMIMQHVAQDVVQSVQAQEHFQRVTNGLEVTLNLVKAWAALVHVQTGHAITDEQRRTLTARELPAWLVDYLNTRAAFQANFVRPVLIHPETFYESLVLLCDIASHVGELKTLVLRDATKPAGTVWIRAIFAAPAQGAYTNLENLVKRLDLENPAERDTVTQIQVLRAMLAINKAQLRLQNNAATGEQALAARLPAAPPVHQLSPALPSVQIKASPAGESQDTLYTLASRALAQQSAGEPDGEESKAMPPTADDRSQDSTHSTPPQDDASSEATETRPVPPPGFRALLQNANDESAESAVDSSGVENATDTLPVPPPDWRERLEQAGHGKANNAATEADPASTPDRPAVENAAETLMLQPLEWQQRLAEADPSLVSQPTPPPEVAERIKRTLQPPAEQQASVGDDDDDSDADHDNDGNNDSRPSAASDDAPISR